MTFNTTLIYTEKLVRDAVWSYWKRSVGGYFFLTILAMTFAIAVLYVQGERSWILGLMGLVVGLGYGVMAILYVAHIKNSMGKFREMGTPHAIFTTDEESFTVESGIGSATLKWSVVKMLWKFQDVWLLMYSAGSYSILPLANIQTDMQAFIIDKVKSNGGKIQ